MAVRFVAPLMILLATQANFIQAAGTTTEPIRPESDSLREFMVLHDWFFDTTIEGGQIQPEKLRDLIREALAIADQLNDPSPEVSHKTEFLRELARYSRHIGCEPREFIDAIWLERSSDLNDDTNRYLQYYNHIGLEECIPELQRRVEFYLGQVEQFGYLAQISMRMRADLAPKLTDQNAINIDMRDSMRSPEFAKVVISHLESISGQLEKPPDQSLNAHLTTIEGLINVTYSPNCSSVRRREDAHTLYRQMIDHGIPASNFAPIVLSAMDYFYICDNLDFYAKHLFPLAKYEFSSLSEQIFTTHEDLTVLPEHMKDLIEAAESTAEAEYYFLRYPNSEEKKLLRDAASVSEISFTKCDNIHSEVIIPMQRIPYSYRNLRRYLVHYSLQQLNECMELLTDDINQSIGRVDQSDINEIEKLRAAMNTPMVGTEPEPRRTSNQGTTDQVGELYIDQISHQVLNEAIISYARSRTLDDDPDEIMPKSPEPHGVLMLVTSLRQSCERFIGAFRTNRGMFRSIIKLDVHNSSGIVPQLILELMTDYNICLTLVKHPSR